MYHLLSWHCFSKNAFRSADSCEYSSRKPGPEPTKSVPNPKSVSTTQKA